MITICRTVFLIVLFGVTILTGCTPSQNAPAGQALEEVRIKGVTFKLELALTPEERAQGLMGRNQIAEDGGMLFVFPDNQHYPAELSFWMKNCLVPIDLIFLDPAGRIVAIHEMEPPPADTPDRELAVYASGAPAQYAIELKGGRAATLGLRVGETIALRFGELLKQAE